VLGECFQSDVDRQTLATLVPTELVSEYVDLPEPVRTHRGRLPDRASPAVGTAIGVSAAMSVVGQADIESAAEVLSSIWPRGRKGSLSSRINTVGRRGADSSPALRGAWLTALEPQLGVPDQLRCRLGAALPRRPATDVAMAFQMATRIPTMFWPQWSLRLADPRSFQRFVRPALSVGLLLVGNDIAVQDGIDLLDCPLSSPSVIAALCHLSESSNWPDIRQALYRLSDYRASPRSTHQLPTSPATEFRRTSAASGLAEHLPPHANPTRRMRHRASVSVRTPQRINRFSVTAARGPGSAVQQCIEVPDPVNPRTG
jgi:hypothetical protein